MSDDERVRLTGWLSAVESGELNIPNDVHDAPAWNKYWHKQMEVGAFDQAFNDMMSSDDRLIAVLKQRGANSILCAGAGLSSEPLALALHGFDVTALDISDVPREVFRATFLHGAHPARTLPGVTVERDEMLVFPAGLVITPELTPKIHQSQSQPPCGGGSLRYVTGDLMDPQVCPGPFDAAIERRTVQLFPPAGQHAALDRLAVRLAPRAFFLSHQHRAILRSDQSGPSFADWREASEFVADHAPNAADSARVASFRLTTG